MEDFALVEPGSFHLEIGPENKVETDKLFIIKKLNLPRKLYLMMRLHGPVPR